MARELQVGDRVLVKSPAPYLSAAECPVGKYRVVKGVAGPGERLEGGDKLGRSLLGIQQVRLTGTQDELYPVDHLKFIRSAQQQKDARARLAAKKSNPVYKQETA